MKCVIPAVLCIRFKKKRFILGIAVLFLVIVIIYQIDGGKNSVNGQRRRPVAFFVDPLQRDWHDYVAITRDSERQGAGEQGQPAVLANLNYRESVEDSLRAHGFNAPLSEYISLNRALPDMRHKSCRQLTYDSRLPGVSIIVVHHNELRSVLLRTLHSLWHRTPPELLIEIILVDDCSDSAFNWDSKVIHEHALKAKVKRIRLNEHVGLMSARVIGARNATGAVLVFLDAHVEATHNWLPPLLQPIFEQPKTCTTPIIDIIDYKTFEYVRTSPSRGGFNWQFNFVQMPLSAEEKSALPAPHLNPVMNGGLFAIQAEFFWQLGAYDEGLQIWGAEQFELSFKIWMCGGRLLEVSCSRFGHLYRDPNFRVKYTNRTDDFISKNYKRVATVWMDEYQELLYEHMPKLTQIDAGDVSSARALRHRLKCKSFKWYLETIAPDLLQTYPPIEPPDYAFGALQSVAAPQFCLDSLQLPTRQQNGALRTCSPDHKHPYVSQNWQLSFRCELQQLGNCAEVQNWDEDAPIWLWPCHHQGGNQFWYYDSSSQMLVHGATVAEHRCLEANVPQQRVYVNFCDFHNVNMKWSFGYVNRTALQACFKSPI